MSQEYRVCLADSISRVIGASDEISYPIELTEILPAKEMRELMRTALQQHGFVEHEGQWVAQGPAGETLTCDLDALTVTASLSLHTELRADVQGVGFGDSGSEAEAMARADLERLREQTESQFDDQSRKLQKQTTRQLEQSEAERMRLLNEIVQEVYAESLKRKARQLGDVTEISETTNAQGQYELTIKVAR